MKKLVSMPLTTYEKLLGFCDPKSEEYDCLRNAVVDQTISGIRVTSICESERASAIVEVAAMSDTNLAQEITVGGRDSMFFMNYFILSYKTETDGRPTIMREGYKSHYLPDVDEACIHLVGRGIKFEPASVTIHEAGNSDPCVTSKYYQKWR